MHDRYPVWGAGWMLGGGIFHGEWGCEAARGRLRQGESIGRMRQMSLAEIKIAATELKPDELAELAAFIQTQDILAWDQEIESDFSPGGKHHGALLKIEAGQAPPFPRDNFRF